MDVSGKKGGIALIYVLFSLIVVFFLSSSPVYAQEITLLGYRFPTITLVPVVIIALGLIFFLAILFRNIVTKIKIIPREKFRKIEQKKLPKIPKQIWVSRKEYYNNELDNLKKKLGRLSPLDAAKKISAFTKDLFGFMFHMQGQYSYEELIPKLKGYPKEEDVAVRLSDLMYGGEYVEKKQLEDVVSEVEQVMASYFQGRPQEVAIVETRGIMKFFSPLFHVFKKIYKKTELIPQSAPVFGSSSKLKFSFKEAQSKEEKVQAKSSLFEKIILKYRAGKMKKQILRLLKFGRNYLDQPANAMKIYSKALLMYYKLPLPEEEEIVGEMESFERMMSLMDNEQKKILGVKKQITQLKKNGNEVSYEALNAIKNLSNILKTNQEKSQTGRRPTREDELLLQIEAPSRIVHEAEHESKNIKVRLSPLNEEKLETHDDIPDDFLIHKVRVPKEMLVKLGRKMIPSLNLSRLKLPEPPHKPAIQLNSRTIQPNLRLFPPSKQLIRKTFLSGKLLLPKPPELRQKPQKQKKQKISAPYPSHRSIASLKEEEKWITQRLSQLNFAS